MARRGRIGGGHRIGGGSHRITMHHHHSGLHGGGGGFGGNYTLASDDQRANFQNDWPAGLCGCCGDFGACIDTTFCYYCMIGNVGNELEHRGQTPPDWAHTACWMACLFDCCVYGTGSCIVGTQLRAAATARYEINEDGCKSFCISCWCPCCSVVQMVRTLGMKGEFPGGMCCAKAPSDAPPRPQVMGELAVPGEGGEGSNGSGSPMTQMNNNMNMNMNMNMGAPPPYGGGGAPQGFAAPPSGGAGDGYYGGGASPQPAYGYGAPPPGYGAPPPPPQGGFGSTFDQPNPAFGGPPPASQGWGGMPGFGPPPSS